jgi:HlyD family secretion protein
MAFPKSNDGCGKGTWMTTKKKVAIGATLVVVISAIVGYIAYTRNRGVVTVQVGRAVRQDLAQNVTANGEIKPKKYVNISSNTMGRIVRMPVKEGDRVNSGDLLIRLESVQTEADVNAAQANLDAAQAELEGMSASERSSQASINTSHAEITRAEAEMVRAKQNFDRAANLNKDGLISKEQYDRTRTELDIATAQLASARARLAQTEAQAAQVQKQRESLALRMAQQRAGLIRARDQFSKTTITAPLDGVITHLPVNEGEIAIVGVQNQPGTVLMTIADMSVITAEVQVDETDIVNVRVGQVAQVKVDALGDRVLPGYVSEVGNSALTRTGALAPGTNTNTQEARDFKVVITLDSPPPELRPGLSSTATIVTAEREAVVTVPIQAIAVRERDDAGAGRKIEEEGVFVVSNGVVTFRPVKTGIIGTTDIELLDGLGENEEIVTGPYQILRTLADNAKVQIAPTEDGR